MKQNSKYSILVVGDASSVHLCRWAGFFKKMNWKVLLFSSDKINDAFLLEFKDEYIRNPYKSFSVLQRILRISRHIKFVSNSRVSAVNYHYLHWNLGLLSLFLRSPLIITCWGSDVLVTYRNSKGIKKLLFDIALKRAQMITFDSDSIRAVLAEKCPSLSSARLRKIYFGIDTHWFKTPSTEERADAKIKLGVSNYRFVLTSIRLMDERYNILEIINWFGQTFQNSSEYCLLIRVPPNPNVSYLNECKHLSSQFKNILFDEAARPPVDMRLFYWGSEACLHFPFSDATPVSMLEAMACGSLVICSSSISAYQDLGEKYRLLIDELDKLDEKKIRRFFEEASIARKFNSEEIYKNASVDTTIIDLNRATNELIDLK